MGGFTADSSIVFVGARATGKTTLALMAAYALNKKIIQAEVIFKRNNEMPSHLYSQVHGTSECQEKQGEVLEQILENRHRGYIIVCSWMGQRVQDVLRQFGRDTPVIHVMREQDSIQDCLPGLSGAETQAVWYTSVLFFRTCANLEFFNVSEAEAARSGHVPISQLLNGGIPRYLALKRAEQHFLRFLRQIYPPGTVFIKSATPLANVPIEHRTFTHALDVTADDVISGRVDVGDASTGADAVQITVDLHHFGCSDADYYETLVTCATQITEAVGRVRRSTVLPIIVHSRPADPVSNLNTNFYTDILMHTLSVAPGMMTVDLRLEDAVILKVARSKSRAKLIGTFFAPTASQLWRSDIWSTQCQRAVRLHCDIVQLIRPATSIDDNADVTAFRSVIAALPGSAIPLSAYNSGSLGRHSAFTNPVLTLVAPEFSDNRGLILTSREATRALYASFLKDPLKLWVFGTNVDYSLSPIMHNAALVACGIPHRYESCSADSLDQVKHLMYDPSFGGASIGLPFKVEVIGLADSLSLHARAIGAVNTLVPIRDLNDDGTVPSGAAFFRNVSRGGPVRALHGENTDWIGIQACVYRGLSPANAVRPTTCALIIGAGGMARAAIYALLHLGVSNIAIYNRTLENGRKLETHFRDLLQNSAFQRLGAGKDTNFDVIPALEESWQSEFRLPSIIISCIPTHSIGDIPSPELKLPESWLAHENGGVIMELGYKTLNTPLLRQAVDNADKGWVAMDGLDLLPDQGFAQFELFTGKSAPKTVMRRVVLEKYAEPEQIARSHPEELRQRMLRTVNES